MAVIPSWYFLSNTRLYLLLVQFDPASGEVDGEYFLMKHNVAGLQEKDSFDFFLAFFMLWFGHFDCLYRGLLILEERSPFLSMKKRMADSIMFTRPISFFNMLSQICFYSKVNTYTFLVQIMLFSEQCTMFSGFVHSPTISAPVFIKGIQLCGNKK